MSARVLIVDDSLTVRMDLHEALEAAGFATEQCATLAAADRALEAGKCHLIVLDVLLPDGDGVEWLARLRAIPGREHLPVILLSTEAEVRDRVRGLRTGADDYVGKPYDVSYLIGRARELVGRGSGGAGPADAILVVDDSVTAREALRRTLEAAGHRVVTAASGEEGLKLAASVRPVALIVDGVLPGIDGATLIRRIKDDISLRHTPCLLLTGSEEGVGERAALDSGADAYMRKSAEPEQILARLTAMLRTAGPATEREAASGLLSPKKVMAVDDSLTYLHELADHLREEGYDVAVARSGAEALELLTVQSVDCILLDLMMPGLSGHETCRRIKATPVWREIPVMVLTALDEHEGMVESINAGADDFITKSADFEVLKARLRAQLRRRQFEDENRRMREQLLLQEMEASKARAAQELAQTRAALLADLHRKNMELNAANAELAQAKERAEQESHFKSRFLASMSHELRTPLNAIIGFSEVLEQELYGPLNPKQKDFIKTVHSSGVHLLNLITDILDLSKIAAGKLELKPAPTALAETLRAVLDVLRPLLDKKKLGLEVDVPGDLPPLMADPVRFKQVLYNLLSNAIKFTGKGGRIRLRAGREDGRVALEVEDTGIGISQEDLGKLFQEFQQVGPRTGDRPEGTGLGLALTRRLVELHGGEISVRSRPGEGSTFTVRLPAAG